MGGLGSGRFDYPNAKQTTRMYRAIDVRVWHRRGLLKPGKRFVWPVHGGGTGVTAIHVRSLRSHVELSYQLRDRYGEWRDYSGFVDLDRVACHFGGARPWFLCPADSCDRRVALLYWDNVFACRHCYNLAYGSQRETPDVRAIRYANRIRKRLRWVPGVVNGHGGKPVGMHWSTFNRLVAEHDELVEIWGADLSRQLQSVYQLIENCRGS